jgi:hypothetical protein
MEWAHQKSFDYRLLGCLVEFVLQNLGSAPANRKKGLGHEFAMQECRCPRKLIFIVILSF